MFDFLEQKNLQNIVRQPDGITCACPVCRAEGHDKTGNHLKIFQTGAFHCIKDSSKPHNVALYNLLYKGEDLEFIFTAPQPKTRLVKIYDESLLTKLTPDYSYWNGRGISDSTLREFGGGVASSEQKSKLWGRYCLPVRDEFGRLIGFSGRLIQERHLAPKWKHIMPSSLALWPLHISKRHIVESSKVIILESPGDCLACWEHGIKNTIVLFGVNLSSKIIAELVKLNPRKIVISTNNDSEHGAGNIAAAKHRNTLLNFFDEERAIIHLPQSKDWGVAKDSEFEGLIKI